MATRATLGVWLACVSAHAAPTVDFYENDGVARYLDGGPFAGQYVLDMTVKNNMDAEPAGNPYGDYVSEFKIEGIYSATTPGFIELPSGWGAADEDGYASVVLIDAARRLWTMRAGTNLSSRRIAPGGLSNFRISITLPTGIAASAIRYGAVAAQGRTEGHGMQPYPIPDTFVGPVGVEYPRPGVSLGVAGGQVGLGLVGLVAGREYRVLRSADLAEWHEAARITVPADPWPESGRADRTWTEAAVLPGRRFYRLEWEEP